MGYERQIVPGTFAHTLSYLIDQKIDMSVFEESYHNDDTGAPAYDPAILLKIILFAYSEGITSSRQIERLCRENVVFITRIFPDVLLVCHEAGLIGREMFAIDGVKLPSNARKEWSGTHADLRKLSES